MDKKFRLVKTNTWSNLKLPFDFFENHFQTMSPTTMKIYLHALYLCTLGNVELKDKDIASRLFLKESEVKIAWEELIEMGLIKYSEDFDEMQFVDLVVFYKNYHKETVIQEKSKGQEIIDYISNNDEYKKRLAFIETIYQKPLNQNDYYEIYDLIESQKVPYGVLLAAIQYSVNRGKKNFNYISKVAINFKELGLTTYESCEDYINNEIISDNSDKFYIYKELKKVFKISRDFYDVELKYIDSWCFEKNKTVEEIKQAVEKTIISIGKINFPYIEKVLFATSSSYQPKNIKKTGMHNFEERSYDYDELMNKLRNK